MTGQKHKFSTSNREEILADLGGNAPNAKPVESFFLELEHASDNVRTVGVLKLTCPEEQMPYCSGQIRTPLRRSC